MAFSVERLRLILVGLAVLLVAVIAGSFVYARWRLRHVAQDLPSRLGVQIQQSTRGFVLSKSERGRPLFTLHAARAVQFKSGGHIALHQVEIDLYSADTGQADTIAGDAFEYDPKSQVVRSRGEARIVLHPPASNAPGAKKANETVRVTTHELEFNQKTGIATCGGEVDFATADSSGQADGAEYDSRQARLVLNSSIVFRTSLQNGPAVVQASHAVYERESGEVHLLQPRFQSSAANAGSNGVAAAATIFVRPDRSVERIHATGAVRLASSAGTTIRAPAMNLFLSETSRPQRAYFTGGVELANARGAQKTLGSAADTEVDFDAQGQADRAILDRAVKLNQSLQAHGAPFERSLTCDHLVLHLSSTKSAQNQLQEADATGNAMFTSEAAAVGKARQQTALAAQQLHMNFGQDNQIRRIDGTGQTRLKTVAENGTSNISTGDTLEIDFVVSKQPKAEQKPVAGPAPSVLTGSAAAQQIRRAIQTGHVVLQQISSAAPAAGARSPGNSTATAERAEYVASADTLTLTGSPVFRNVQLGMSAGIMVIQRASGNMTARGGVQATLLAPASSGGNIPSVRTESSGKGGLLSGTQPAHVISENANLIHATGEAIFNGRARLWQGDNSIEAPTIALSQRTRTLLATGDPACAHCVVASFVSSPSRLSTADKTARAGASQPVVFRVLSGRLLYSDAEREATFTRRVTVDSSLGELSADRAQIFLAAAPPVRPAGAKRNVATPQTLSDKPESSSVEKMIATGGVRLLQPGRKATGTRLVYTAEDGHFVLTGTPAAPPKVVDVDRGTVVGQVLTFSSPAQAIMVTGAPGRAAVTRTTARKR